MWRVVIAISAYALVAMPAPAAAATTTVCVVADERVSEVSGLVATADGYVAINDGNWDPAAITVFFFNRACRVTETVGYPTAARDPEDLASAPDGTLWIADIGDNANAEVRRQTVALWRLAPKARKPVIYRFTYPDGPHDAEALLLDGDGTPIIVTKELAGPAKIFVPARAPVPGTRQGVPLRLAGEVRLPSTSTPNPFGALGRQVVTGAAQSPDRRWVTLRSYADAFEWPVVGGDVVSSITTGEPRITALPDEPQGEAIAYTVDGSAYLTASDQPAGATVITRYGVPPRRAAEPTASTASARPGAAAASLLPPVLVGVVTAGLGLAGLGLLWLRRRTRV